MGYEKGKVYKVVNSVDNMVYEGFTTYRLRARLSDHCYRARQGTNDKFHSHIRLVGTEHFDVVLKEHPCESYAELQAAAFEEMGKLAQSLLLNENTEMGKYSSEHSRKIGDAQRAEKSHKWKFGSVFVHQYLTDKGYQVHAWVYDYICPEAKKHKRFQSSINRHGYEKAREMVTQKRKEIFPDAPDPE